MELTLSLISFSLPLPAFLSLCLPAQVPKQFLMPHTGQLTHFRGSAGPLVAHALGFAFLQQHKVFSQIKVFPP